VFRSHGVFRSTSQEFDLISPKLGAFSYVAGLFYQKYHNSEESLDHMGFGFDLNGDPRLDYGSPWFKDEQTDAVFAQLSYEITPALQLQVGARWGHYEFTQWTNFLIDFSGFSGGPSMPLIPLENGGAGNKQGLQENSTDWKVNLNYEINDDHFVYGLISRGHTPGSINFASPSFFADPDHGAYKQMSVINYEGGWKASFLNKRIRTQFDVYYQVFKDYQADFALGDQGPANSQLFQFQNALTDSKIYGAEFGAQASLGDARFDFGFAYNRSKLGSFGQIVNTFAGVPGYDPRPTVDLAGASTPFSPKITTNAGASYKIHLPFAEWNMIPRLDIAYRSDAYSRLYENNATLLPGYAIANGQLKFDNGSTFVELWCTNLADKRYVSAKQNVDGAGPTAEYPFQHIVGIVYGGLPRMYGVRVGHSF
jgi:iron complex outermembrane receptor protein